MNYIDLAILVIIGIGALTGLIRGFIKELIETVGILLAAVVANLVSPLTTPLLGYIGVNHQDATTSIIVWVVVFLILLFLLKQLSFLTTKLLKVLSINWLNRLLGLAFGVVKYTLIVCLLVSLLEVVCSHLDGSQITTWMKQSNYVPYIHDIISFVSPYAEQYIIRPVSAIVP